MYTFVLVNGNWLYFLRAHTEPEGIQRFQPIFESIAQSIRFNNPVDPTLQKTENQKAIEGGEQIGKITAYVMIAVVAIFGFVAVIKWVVFRKK